MPHLDYTDKELNHLSRNEQFLRRVRETVESNLSNEQFGVENLVESMAMSRIQMYRKLHKLIGKNISQYTFSSIQKMSPNLLGAHLA